MKVSLALLLTLQLCLVVPFGQQLRGMLKEMGSRARPPTRLGHREQCNLRKFPKPLVSVFSSLNDGYDAPLP